MLIKHKNDQKFKVCEYPRGECCGRPHSVLRKVYAVFALENLRTKVKYLE